MNTIEEENYEELCEAIEEAGGCSDIVLAHPAIRQLLNTLAQNSICLTATYTGGRE